MAIKIFRYYLLGREAAEEDFDPDDDLDVVDLAKKALAGTDLRDLTRTAVTDLLAIDPHDGSESEWTEEHADDIEEDGLLDRIGEVYKEWRRGWTEQAMLELEIAVVEAMYEELDELIEAQDGESEDDGDDEDDEDGEDEDESDEAPKRRRGRR